MSSNGLTQSDENQEKIVLNKFLRRAERLLYYIPVLDRGRIVKELADFVRESAQESNQSIVLYLKSFHSKDRMIELFLKKKGYPLPRYRISPFKILLLSITSIIVIIAIALTIFIKSLFPLFEVDGKDKVVRVLGGKLVFSQEQQDFLNEFEEYPHKTKGTIPLEELKGKELIFTGSDGSVLLKDHIGPIEYDCRSKSKELYNIKSENYQLLVHFAKGARCTLRVPKQYPVKMNFE